MSKGRETEVLVCAPVIGNDLAPLREVNESVRVIDGNEVFARYRKALRDGDAAARDEALVEIRRLLANAEVLCMMYPMLPEVRPYAPRLKWLHHTMAGVSNLWSCDLWHEPDVVITSGRGHVNATAIAEYALAGVLAFARGMHGAFLNKRAGALDHGAYHLSRLAGAKLGVVGLGGIGREVARLARALGMQAVGTRLSVGSKASDVDYADVVYPAAELHEMAADCDFIVVCTQLTAATTELIDAPFFSALKKRPVLVNVSRGEVVDEAAMLDALRAGLIRGAVLDVYAGELARKPPRPELLNEPNILLTPHISGLGGDGGPEMLALFKENLRRYVSGEPLLNRVDRERGY